MNKLRIKPEFLALITSGQFETFTIPQLTAAYLKLSFDQSLSKKAVTQFILRNINRLLRFKLIEKNSKKSGRSIVYKLRSNFGSNSIIEGSPHFLKEHKQEHGLSNFSETLMQRYSLCKTELLTAIGEVEEYESLIKDAPNQRENIQQLYNNARDLCSKNLGRVRALETLIQSQNAS